MSVMSLSSNNSRQAVHTQVPLSPSSVIWYRPRASQVYPPVGTVIKKGR